MAKTDIIKCFWKALLAFMLLSQYAQASMKSMTHEQLVEISEHIVIAKVLTGKNTGKSNQLHGGTANILKNKLKVIESLKGEWSLKKPLFLNIYEFDDLMEDNVALAHKESKVLLLLKRDEKGELKLVNGIQGIWKINSEGKTKYGMLKEIREIVGKQSSKVDENCSSKAFISLLDMAETQTQKGQYSQALESYRNAYSVCPMRDLEEQMAWLMGEVGFNENNNLVKEGE